MQIIGSIRVSVIGVGHMGKLHAEKLSKMPDVNFMGVYDIDAGRAKEIAVLCNTRAFDTFEEAMRSAHAIILATPTETHTKMGVNIIKNNKHLFIEKPISSYEDEAEILLSLASERNLVLMVGHIENFNPAFIVARTFIKDPLFVESHRLTSFRGRGADVSVIEDLMVHDIELLVSICGAEIKSLDASAASVITNYPDIANVRIRFASGCVANLTASRLSLSSKRKMRLFQKDAYISIDFENRIVEIASPVGERPEGQIVAMGDFRVEICRPEVAQTDALEQEISTFLRAIRGEFIVSAEPALEAMLIVKRIVEALRK